MTFWVHRSVGGVQWSADATLDPPKPAPSPGRGYPYYFVEFDGMTFEFASVSELRVCLAVLSQKLLPSTRRLSQGTGAGPNSHWLSRLPSFVKRWSYRKRACAYLTESLASFLVGG